MKIPKQIKIGWRNYTIQSIEDKRDEKGDLLNGEIDYVNHIISIDKNLLEDEKILTFIHEMIHGIFHNQGNLKWRDNENLICAVSEGLFQIIKDNPKVFNG